MKKLKNYRVGPEIENSIKENKNLFIFLISLCKKVNNYDKFENVSIEA